MARGPSSPTDKFVSSVDADGSMSPAELLDLCAEELELKSMMLDGLADGIMVHTAQGSLLYFNPAAATIYGYTPEEFAQVGEWGWVPPEAREAIVGRVDALRQSGQYDFQSVGYLADKSRILTEVHARRLVLPRVGEVLVSVIQDVTERLAAQDTIKHLAFHDPLTGLANRVMLDEQLRMAMASSQRYGETVGVVYLDLNAFKPVNDTFGHAAGDVVLKTVADRLVATVREYDTVARIGGDEFLVLFPRLEHREDLRMLSRKLQECLGRPIHVGDHSVRVSAKVGLATYHRGEAPDELISRADHEMYRSSALGVAGWDAFDANN
jgi:diguanylate cyclase (GGDEF)-like protein/PAS domain S-box-containing protein